MDAMPRRKSPAAEIAPPAPAADEVPVPNTSNAPEATADAVVVGPVVGGATSGQGTAAPAARKRRPDLPRAALPIEIGEVQVNSCKNPKCANFGVPVPRKRTKGVPDPYRLIGAGSAIGSIHVRCMLCSEKLPMKSNAGVVEELERMLEPQRARKPISCPHEGCAHHAVGVETPRAYRAYGRNSAGSPRWKCKACGRVFSRSLRPTGRQEKTSRNRLLFKALLGKAPIRRLADIVELDPRTIRRRIDFIHGRCVAFAADRESQLATMEIPRLYLSVDGQEQIINWRSREDRRNIVLSAIASVDNRTGYCFGMHLNFDPSLDREGVERDSAALGDPAKPVALRKYARLWLEQDYRLASAAKAVRKRAKAQAAAPPMTAPGLLAAVDEAYADQQGREDIESPDDADAPRALPAKGMQTRRDYTMHAHFAYLRRLCPKVGKWRFFLDQDPGMRAAVMSAFTPEIKAGTCDAFFVRVAKDMTINKRRKARKAANDRLAAVLLANPGMTEKKAVLELIKAAHAAMTPHGRWNDRWLDHPYPDMGEPEKAVCWLTERDGMDPDHMAALYHKASIHGVDSFFNQLRRRSSMLERPIHTSSGSGRVWSAYSAYDPARTMRLLEIIRVCHNFVWPSEKDGKTPAQRFGLARVPLDYSDILDFPW